MENHDASQIYGNNADAPYINGTLVPTYAHATNFDDELAQSIPSEPHYVWMEAGTNTFADRTFTTDADPSQSNSTSSTEHLTTQIKNAPNGVTWRTYQEGMNASTGACPIHKAGFYAPKHDPFVFFRDVAGSPPSATSPDCSAYHRPYGSLAETSVPATCELHVHHARSVQRHARRFGCPSSNTIRAGDTWLSTELPRLIDYASRNAGVIFLTWDEGDDTCKLPFLAIGPGVKPGYAGSVTYNHSSLVKSIEQIESSHPLDCVGRQRPVRSVHGRTVSLSWCGSSSECARWSGHRDRRTHEASVRRMAAGSREVTVVVIKTVGDIDRYGAPGWPSAAFGDWRAALHGTPRFAGVASRSSSIPTDCRRVTSPLSCFVAV